MRKGKRRNVIKVVGKGEEGIMTGREKRKEEICR